MTASSTYKEMLQCTRCSRNRKITSRGMCESCYRTWRRQTFPEAREAQRRCNRKYQATPKGVELKRRCGRRCYRKRYDTDPEYRRMRNYHSMGYPYKFAKELAKLNLPKRRETLEFSGL